MAWWQQAPFGGALNELGAAVSTANATWFLVAGTFASAIATVAAVVAALFVPTWLAAREQRRKHAAALKLAELACDALGSNPTADPVERTNARAKKSWRANIRSLVDRMDRMPSDYIDDAAALALFIWTADLLREALSIDSDFNEEPSVVNAVERLDMFCDLGKAAKDRLHEMRQRLKAWPTPRR